MQSVSSRIWTRVAVYISYDDNHYTTGTSLKCHNILEMRVAETNKHHFFFSILLLAQTAGVAEYTDEISTVG